MASQTEIVNMALHKLGANRVTAITDDSKEARTATDVWGPCRDSVLQDHLWNFATRRATLAQLSSDPDWGYDYQFQLPTDCLRVIEMSDPDYEFRVETVKVGAQEYKVLLTDESTAEISYIARIENTGFYSSKFVDALAARLAAEMAFTLTGSTRKEKMALDAYQLILSDARSVDAMEGTPMPVQAEDWLDARE